MNITTCTINNVISGGHYSRVAITEGTVFNQVKTVFAIHYI